MPNLINIQIDRLNPIKDPFLKPKPSLNDLKAPLIPKTPISNTISQPPLPKPRYNPITHHNHPFQNLVNPLLPNKSRRKSAFSVCQPYDTQEVSSDSASGGNKTFDHIDERSWDSEEDHLEKVTREINEDDPEPGPIQIDLRTVDDKFGKPLYKDQAISTDELPLSPGGLATTSVGHELKPPSSSHKIKHVKRNHKRIISSRIPKSHRKRHRNNFLTLNIPRLKPSPNRGIPGKFMRSNIIKPSEFTSNSPKPGLLTDQEFLKTKAKILALHKEQADRAERRRDKLQRQQELFKKEDEEQERIKKINEELKHSLIEERRKQIELRLKQRDQMRQAKKKEIREINKRSRTVMKSTPMYVKMK